MHFVSYYYDRDETKSIYYKTCSSKIKSQLESYGYNTSFNHINFFEQGLNTTYLKLNMIKPKYLLQKMEELDDSVVWIDADCYLTSRLEEFENLSSFDMGVCMRVQDATTPHAAILYFNNTDNSRHFLREWQSINEIKEKDDTYDCSEHCTLIDLFKETKIPLNVKEFTGIVYATDYENIKKVEPNSEIKLWIGISQGARDYERNRYQ